MPDHFIRDRIAARILALAAAEPESIFAKMSPAQVTALADIADRHHSIAASEWDNLRLASYLTSVTQSEAHIFAPQKPAAEIAWTAEQRLGIENGDNPYDMLSKHTPPTPLSVEELKAIKDRDARHAALSGDRLPEIPKTKKPLPEGWTTEALMRLPADQRLDVLNGAPGARLK